MSPIQSINDEVKAIYSEVKDTINSFIQPKESKCKACAYKVGNAIKKVFSNYCKMWKDLYAIATSSWHADKKFDVLIGLGVAQLAVTHILAIAMLIKGAVLLGMGTGGVGLLVFGAVSTALIFGWTAHRFDVFKNIG